MGKSGISVSFSPSPHRTVNTVKHSYESLVCFHTCLLVKDMHKPGLIFRVGLRFTCAKFPVQIYGWREPFKQLLRCYFIINSHKILTSFFSSYPNIRTYTVTCSSQLKWIIGFILYTLYSSEQCAFCNL